MFRSISEISAIRRVITAMWKDHPLERRNMDHSTAQKIHEALIKLNIPNIEFTGGAPEINSNLKFFIEGLSKCGKKVTVQNQSNHPRTSRITPFIPIFIKIIESMSWHPCHQYLKRSPIGKEAKVSFIPVLGSLRNLMKWDMEQTDSC